MASYDPKKAAAEVQPPARRDVSFLKAASKRRSKRLSEDYSTLSVYIRRSTHRKVKGKAGMQGIDMSDVAEQLLLKWVRNEVKL